MNITYWYEFNDKLISNFGNVAVCGQKVHCQFNISPRTDSMKELVEDLAPRVNTLVNTLNCIEIFHLLHNLTLTPALNKH